MIKKFEIAKAIIMSLMAIAYTVLACGYILADKPDWICCAFVIIAISWAVLSGIFIYNAIDS
jgi:hypothetical protein